MSRAAREDDGWEPYGGFHHNREWVEAVMRLIERHQPLFEFRVAGETRFQIERKRKEAKGGWPRSLGASAFN